MKFSSVSTFSRCLMIAGVVALGLTAQGHAADAKGDSGDASKAAYQKDSMPDPTTAASNPLSDAGTSGLHLYRRHCQSCHGYLGVGTKRASALIRTRYSQDHRSRREFHENFRHMTNKHVKIARGTRKKPGPRFNDLELIAKFLREIEAWHAVLKRAGAEGN